MSYPAPIDRLAWQINSTSQSILFSLEGSVVGNSGNEMDAANLAGSHMPWVTWLIAGLCIAMFVALEVAGVPALIGVLACWWDMPTVAAFHSAEFWTYALPATLMHAGVLHLAVNLWCLGVFGPVFERRFGHLALLLLWIVVAYVVSVSNCCSVEHQRSVSPS